MSGGQQEVTASSSQITTGLYRLTQIPALYAGLQTLLGGRRTAERLVADHFKPKPGDRILDIGCGSCSILPYLGEISYTGVDLNPDHIAAARALYGTRATLICGDAEAIASLPSSSFDLVLCIGLFHHLDDGGLSRLGHSVHDKLVSGGRLVSVDPALVEGQHWIARRLALADSGRCVREPEGYARVLGDAFAAVETAVRHDLLRVPYTHAILTATRTS